MLCAYNCGQEGKYQLKNGKYCCSEHFNQCPANRLKNSNGLKKSYSSGKIKSGKEKFLDFPEESKENMKWNKGLTKENDDRLKNTSINLKQKFENGEIIPYWNNKNHTIESRKKMSEHRIKFLEENKGNNILWYSIYNGYKIINVQGKWEKTVAERLNELKINWDRIRVKFDKSRSYTPDFYLPDFDVYIEVKGWMSENDKCKMWKCIHETNIKILLIDDKKLLNTFDIVKLEYFNDKYPYEDIDYSKFNNIWDK
jgi:hypothetical protein